ncbi:MAG: hypothetical protein FJ202_04965 [Gemmatimonadetes bacterium]|nr:hypothetical protein [Gemmatimonadota bacterium]
MFGCLRRLILLFVLVCLGAAAWFTRDRWEPIVREKIGARPRAVAAPPQWEPVTPAGVQAVSAAIATFRRPNGPAFQGVRAGDFAAFALWNVLRGWSTGPGGIEARADSDALLLRATLRISDPTLLDAAGPLGNMLKGDQPIEIEGRVVVLDAGRAEYRVSRMTAGQLKLPSAAIGVLLKRWVPAGSATSARNAFPLNLGPEIADVRIRAGEVTLYTGAR